jgi:hypothetical protein
MLPKLAGASERLSARQSRLGWELVGQGFAAEKLQARRKEALSLSEVEDFWLPHHFLLHCRRRRWADRLIFTTLW